MFKALRRTIGIIGYGTMGAAIAGRLKSRYRVIVFEKDRAKSGQADGLRLAKNSGDLVSHSDAVILAVKPQDFATLLGEIRETALGKLIISIAAGKTTASIENCLPQARVVRVMPNLGVRIGKAESCLCRGRSASRADLSFARRLFDLVGKTWILDESMIDAATAITGSGPAYIFYDMEITGIDPHQVPERARRRYSAGLQEAARAVGFDQSTARAFASSVTATACALAEESAVPVATLRAQVTSKGGTTAAALEQLAAGKSWSEAALAAKKRAAELSDPLPSPG